MKIYILQTCKGSEDGFRLREFRAGQSYDLADNLARFLIAERKARIDTNPDIPPRP